ncbi:FkbM family methyltransferase [Streptomyces sp. NPDC094448]|uniref:FkbM family methyltransferase n=1 Tax=Streptomyces sp. NPDC094448 TaxID=3366063 RepID=UPI003812A2ED
MTTESASDRTSPVVNSDGLHMRPRSYDQRIWVESRQYLAMAPRPSDVLLDVGANIGTVTHRFLTAGISRVIAFEPEAQNHRLLLLNTGRFGDRAVLRPEAIAATAGPRRLWTHNGRNHGLHSLVAHPRRRCMVVPAVPLAEVLDEYRPTLLKIDIEGGEYELLPDLRQLPSQVRAVAIELHLWQDGWRREHGPDLVAAIRAQGFRDVRPPHIGPGNPCSLAIWAR